MILWINDYLVSGCWRCPVSIEAGIIGIERVVDCFVKTNLPALFLPTLLLPTRLRYFADAVCGG